MAGFDNAVLQCFLDQQLDLYPEEVAGTLEEAEEFLEDSGAVVLASAKEVKEYYEEAGVDTEGENVLEALEVFAVGDGRYLIVEGA